MRAKSLHSPSSVVDRKMTAKVDARKLYLSTDSDLHAKLVLELAVEIARTTDPNYTSVSFAAQEEAAAYFNEHGFVETLNHMFSLRGGGKY